MASEPNFGLLDSVLGLIGGEREGKERQLEQDLLHEAETQDQRDVDQGGRVEPDDVVERVEVADARETSSDEECESSGANAQLPLLPGRLARLVSRFGDRASFAPPAKRCVTAGDEHQHDRRHCPANGDLLALAEGAL